MTGNRLKEVDYAFHCWKALECSGPKARNSPRNMQGGPVYCAMQSVRNLIKQSTQASLIPLLRVLEIMLSHKLTQNCGGGYGNSLDV